MQLHSTGTQQERWLSATALLCSLRSRLRTAERIGIVRQGHDHEDSNTISAMPLQDIRAGLTMIPVVEWKRSRKRNGMRLVRGILTAVRV